MGFYAAQAYDYSYSTPGEQETIGLSACSRPSVHGALRFMCTGPNVKLRVMCSLAPATPPSRIAVRVDGAASSVITPATSYEWDAITIPTGTHLVEVQAGQQSGPAYPANVAGTWVDAISATDLVVLPPVTGPKWICFLGDSIANGQPTNPGQDDFITLIRAAVAPLGWLVANDSYGFRTMWDITTEGAAIGAARIDRICRGGTQIRVVNFLGTNDYGLPKQSALNYGLSWDGLISALNTQMGARLERIVALTPFLREVESANSFGDPLSSYRTAAAARVGGKVTTISGLGANLVVPTDYDDSPGLHPNSNGHANKIATWLAPLVVA